MSLEKQKSFEMYSDEEKAILKEREKLRQEYPNQERFGEEFMYDAVWASRASTRIVATMYRKFALGKINKRNKVCGNHSEYIKKLARTEVNFSGGALATMKEAYFYQMVATICSMDMAVYRRDNLYLTKAESMHGMIDKIQGSNSIFIRILFALIVYVWCHIEMLIVPKEIGKADTYNASNEKIRVSIEATDRERLKTVIGGWKGTIVALVITNFVGPFIESILIKNGVNDAIWHLGLSLVVGYVIMQPIRILINIGLKKYAEKLETMITK